MRMNSKYGNWEKQTRADARECEIYTWVNGAIRVKMWGLSERRERCEWAEWRTWDWVSVVSSGIEWSEEVDTEKTQWAVPVSGVKNLGLSDWNGRCEWAERSSWDWVKGVSSARVKLGLRRRKNASMGNMIKILQLMERMMIKLIDWVNDWVNDNKIAFSGYQIVDTFFYSQTRLSPFERPLTHKYPHKCTESLNFSF